MKKRGATLLWMLLLFLSLSVSALADMIYEPEEEFFRKHEDECYYENRDYIVAGAEGYAVLQRTPEGGGYVNVANGEVFRVSWIWDGGDQGLWGLVSYYDEAYQLWQDMWLPLADAEVKYDAISFAQEYGGEFLHPEEGRTLDLSGYGSMQLWAYPGAEAPFASFGWTGEDAWLSEAPEDLTFYTLYEDAQGRTWGNLGYLYGYRDFWVCLTDPEAASFGCPAIPAPTEAPAPTASPAPSPTLAAPAPSAPCQTPQPSRGEGASPWLPAGLAGGAVVLAGILLALFRKKK